MANFQTHLNGGLFVSGAAVLALHSVGEVTPSQTLPLFALGVAGSLLPDIDADHSRPVRIFFGLLGTVLAFIVTLPLIDRLGLAQLAVLWAVVFLLVRYGVFKLFARLTVHRGIWHSWLALIACALVVSNAAYRWFSLDAHSAWIAGLMLAIGYFTHLLLDELYSVDLLNKRIKRSFGTALKPLSLKKPFSSALMLGTALALLWIAPPSPLLDPWRHEIRPEVSQLADAFATQARAWQQTLRQMFN